LIFVYLSYSEVSISQVLS